MGVFDIEKYLDVSQNMRMLNNLWLAHGDIVIFS